MLCQRTWNRRMQQSLTLSFLALIGFWSPSISVPTEAPKRRCSFLASPQNREKAQQMGNVSGNVQHCFRTDCCIGIFRLEHGIYNADFLACGLMDTTCTESSNHVSLHDQNYIICICNSDLCNFNITLNNQDKQTQGLGPSRPQHSSDSDLHYFGILVFPAGALIILFFLITALKWKYHLNDYGAVTSSISEDTDTDLVNTELQKVVVCGHFACVWQGYFQGSPVALKVFPAMMKQEFDKEKHVYMLPFMKHAGIAKFLGAGRMGREFVLVLELATQGSLNVFLTRTVCDWPSTIKLAQTLSQGLAYLHTELNKNGVYKPAVAHCDLSSNNVLIRADGSCALCDFGCSMVLLNSGKTEGRIQMGTLRYMSPEILEGSVNLSSDQCLLQGDVYSLGLLLWELLMRCSDLCKDSQIPAHMMPYEAELGLSPKYEDLLAFVSEQRARPAIPPHWCRAVEGISLRELLEDCWDHEADARLTAQCAADRLAMSAFEQEKT